MADGIKHSFSATHSWYNKTNTASCLRQHLKMFSAQLKCCLRWGAYIPLGNNYGQHGSSVAPISWPSLYFVLKSIIESMVYTRTYSSKLGNSLNNYNNNNNAVTTINYHRWLHTWRQHSSSTTMKSVQSHIHSNKMTGHDTSNMFLYQMPARNLLLWHCVQPSICW